MQSASARRHAGSLPSDRALVTALRGGDAAAFTAVVDTYGPGMLRLARTFVPSHAVAEEVVQETWAAVLHGLGRFEGRSSLRTWIYRILINTAKTRGCRERRSAPMSCLGKEHPDAPAVDADRFLSAGHGGSVGRWALAPLPWPEQALLRRETRAVVARAVERLPAAQRAVLSLRDVEGWPAEETCRALGLTEVNQRVLLHRARSKVRAEIESYLGAVEMVAA